MIYWGMIGCGNVAETKSGPALYNADKSKLVMVSSRDEIQTKNFAKRHNIKHWTTNPKELINNNEINAVYVATPPDSHLYYGKLVAESGKHLLMEKPLARNIEEANELINCCNDNDITLCVAYYRRALPRFLKVKEWLNSKIIGTPTFVHIQHNGSPENHPVSPIDSKNIPPLNDIPWRFIPEISGGGNFVDCGTHMLDMVDYLLGPITDVKGLALNQGGIYPAEDSVSGSYMVDGNIPGTGQWNYVSGTEIDRIEIVGSKGSIRLSCFDECPLELETSKGIELFEAKNPRYWHQPFIQNVVNTLLGNDFCLSTGDNALRAMEVKWKFLKNYYNKYPGM